MVGCKSCHFNPPCLSPSRWPNVPKRKSKNSQCSVKSMSGKDVSSLPFCLLFLLSSENKRVNSGQTVSPERRQLFWCATRFGQCTVKPITPWPTPLGFDLCPRCHCHDNPLLCLLYWCNSPQMLCWKQINSPGGHKLRNKSVDRQIWDQTRSAVLIHIVHIVTGHTMQIPVSKRCTLSHAWQSCTCTHCVAVYPGSLDVLAFIYQKKKHRNLCRFRCK